MIDLNALEKQPLIDITTHPDPRTGLSSSPIVAVAARTLDALIRVARAAQDLTAYPFADFGRSEFEALEAALKPFQLGDS